jgi:predicted nucleic acid-binding Zn finger protein
MIRMNKNIIHVHLGKNIEFIYSGNCSTCMNIVQNVRTRIVSSKQ